MTVRQGGGEAVTALLGNHIQFIVENPGEINPYLAAGQFRVLAATSKIPTLPDVKTLEELGYGIDVPDSFRAIFAPPGISKEAKAGLSPAAQIGPGDSPNITEV